MDEKETDEKVERIRNNPFVQIGGRIELIKREGYEPKAVIFNDVFRKRIIDPEGIYHPEDIKRLSGLKSIYGLEVFILNSLADDEILIAYDPMHP